MKRLWQPLYISDVYKNISLWWKWNAAVADLCVPLMLIINKAFNAAVLPLYSDISRVLGVGG